MSLVQYKKPLLIACDLSRPDLHKRALGAGWTGSSTISRGANTGVSAQQISVVDNDHIIIFDKAENNPLQVNGKPAWGSLYTISTGAVRPLGMITNSFCAGGGWLGNGTLVSVGGNPSENNLAQNGYQALRLFTPCDDSGTVSLFPVRVRPDHQHSPTHSVKFKSTPQQYASRQPDGMRQRSALKMEALWCGEARK